MTLYRRVWRAGRPLVAVLAALPLLAAAYAYRLQAGLDELSIHAGQRLALASASLNAELQRFESLPVALALHPSLRALLARPADAAGVAATNVLLADIAARTGAAQLYVMAPSGETLAANNWQTPGSLVGQNYAFRPYFQDALAGRAGMFFAVGATTGIPGFFIAHPVRAEGHVAGVAAVKVELAPLEATWAASGEALMVVDRHGVVALSSDPAWKFGTLTPLSGESRRELAQTRQYYSAALEPLTMRWIDAQRVLLDGHEYVVQERSLTWGDWRMLMLADVAPVRAAARGWALATGLALCVLGVGALYWRQRARRLRERLAAQVTLERTVAERTADLARSNQQLLREIDERGAAEHKLRGAQQALIEANRLAALGQMAAGVVHELNQPLSAIRGFAGNGLTFLERGQSLPVKDNLQQIIGLVERMARLTAQLKVFASRQSSSLQRQAAGPTRASEAIATVANWFAARLARAGVRLEVTADAVDLPLEAQALEQILSNLIGNALDALAERGAGTITVRACRLGGARVLEVEDDGPGIPEAVRERITQPFFTTKPLGQGLGLGLPIVIDLVEAAGGGFEIGPGAAGGTLARARWPDDNAAGEPASPGRTE